MSQHCMLDWVSSVVIIKSGICTQCQQHTTRNTACATKNALSCPLIVKRGFGISFSLVVIVYLQMGECLWAQCLSLELVVLLSPRCLQNWSSEDWYCQSYAKPQFAASEKLVLAEHTPGTCLLASVKNRRSLNPSQSNLPSEIISVMPEVARKGIPTQCRRKMKKEHTKRGFILDLWIGK